MLGFGWIASSLGIEEAALRLLISVLLGEWFCFVFIIGLSTIHVLMYVTPNSHSNRIVRIAHYVNAERAQVSIILAKMLAH